MLPLTLIHALVHGIMPGALVRLAKLIGSVEESEVQMGGRRFQKHVFQTDKVRTVSTLSEAVLTPLLQATSCSLFLTF